MLLRAMSALANAQPLSFLVLVLIASDHRLFDLADPGGDLPPADHPAAAGDLGRDRAGPAVRRRPQRLHRCLGDRALPARDRRQFRPAVHRRVLSRRDAAGLVVGALLRDQLLPPGRGTERPADPAGKPGDQRPAGDAALPAQPALPVQHAQFDLDAGAAQADRAGQCHAQPAVLVPALYADQRADGAGDRGAGSRDAQALSRHRADALRGAAAHPFRHRSGDARPRCCPRCCSSRWSRMRSNMRSARRKPARKSPSPRNSSGQTFASPSPTPVRDCKAAAPTTGWPA